MTDTPTVTDIYVGTREAMIAECAAFDPTGIGVPARACKFLVLPIGNAQWDTEYFATIREARAHATELANVFNVKICYVD